MADNIAVTAGSGTTVATDQVGLVHYQKVKIFDGTADSENGLVVDSNGNAMVKLAAGTAAIGKLAANDGVDIGNVDVASLPAISGTVTANLGTTDTTNLASIKTNTDKIPALGQALAAASVPVILPAATITTLTPPAAITNYANETGGNLASIKTNTDKLPSQGQAAMAASVPVAIASNQSAISVTAAGDVASGGTDSGNPVKIAGKYNATLPTISDGQRCDIQVEPRGGLLTAIKAYNSTTAIGARADNADGVAVAAAGSNLAVSSRPTVFNGTSYDRVYGTVAGIYSQGSVADDGTTPANPLMIGGQAVETDGTDPGSVSAEGDVAQLKSDRNRRLLVNEVHPNLWTYSHDETSAQTDHEVVAAPGANLSLYITDIVVSNGATAGTIKFELDTASAKTQVGGTKYLAINGGWSAHFKTPYRITANKNFGFSSVTCTTHSVEVHGYTAP